MYGYGINAGTSSDGDYNRVVKLQGRRLLDDGALESLAGGLTLDGKSSASEWTDLAAAVADELESRSVYPLGVAAPLTLSEIGTRSGRPFESLVRTPFRTPSTFEAWPGKVDDSQLHLTRLWTEVAWILTQERKWTLWVGEGHTLGTKVIVEVYPRQAWTSLMASRRAPVLKQYGRSVQVRDDALEALQLRFVDRDRPTKELRDAAVSAATVGKVITRTAGYLGKPVEQAEGERALRGGGIAVPWLR